MKRLIIELIFNVFAILLLSVVSNAEITGDLTNANAVMTGETTFKLSNVTVSGDIPTNTYWAEFRWDPIKLAFVPIAYGVDVNNGDFTMITPYVSSSDIRSIWLFNNDSHRGIDFQPSGNLIPFRAVSSGVIESIELMQLESTSNWQVEVEIKYNSTYSAFYAFEPMTADQADGEIQLTNILFSVGQDVSQGDIIGYLYSAGEGAHVHFGLFKYIPNGGDPTICPEPYFTPEARDSLLNRTKIEYF
ncbi:MAG: M23 family metallopeptidase [Candidatus Hodarchaeales archaeon]|jgi:hypothetical protein